MKNLYNLLIICVILGSTDQCRAEYNLATKQEEHLFFTTAGEVKLGRSIARQIDEKFKVSKDIKLSEQVEHIGKKVASVCERKDIAYSFTILESDKPNAFALPGGYVYINRGLLEKIDSEDEIAACLAHEISHIVARHSVKRLQASLGYNLLSLIALAASKDVRFKRGTDLAFNQLMLGYSREDELLADRLSVKYLRKAGYNPDGVIALLEKLKKIKKEAPLQPLLPAYARTHPYITERIAAAKKEIYGKIDFNDYINE
jgi:predicted Zn-dependent protease